MCELRAAVRKSGGRRGGGTWRGCKRQGLAPGGRHGVARGEGSALKTMLSTWERSEGQQAQLEEPPMRRVARGQAQRLSHPVTVAADPWDVTCNEQPSTTRSPRCSSKIGIRHPRSAALSGLQPSQFKASLRSSSTAGGAVPSRGSGSCLLAAGSGPLPLPQASAEAHKCRRQERIPASRPRRRRRPASLPMLRAPSQA